jgi:hypothetical protein
MLTPNDWAMCVKLLKGYFKHSFSLTAEEQVFWFEELKHYAPEEVFAAVRHLGRHMTDGFPKVGHLIQFIEGKAEDQAALLWGEAKQHLHRMIYPLYQGGQVVPIPWSDARIPAAIEALGGARALLQMDVDNEMATRAHFQKAFVAIARREAEDDTRKRLGLSPRHEAIALNEQHRQNIEAIAQGRRAHIQALPGPGDQALQGPGEPLIELPADVKRLIKGEKRPVAASARHEKVVRLGDLMKGGISDDE